MMKKKPRKSVRKHTVIMIVGSVLLLSALGGFLYFQAITHVAMFMLSEVQELQMPEHIPAPSALLLFSMGFLGLLGVRLSENKQKSNLSSAKHLKKAAN